MKFIRAEKKDIPLLQELARKSWESAYRKILSEEQIQYMLDLMYAEEVLIKHLQPFGNYRYYVLKEGFKPLGFLGFELHQEESTTKLHRIYLLPEEKGKGWGKQAIEFLKTEVLTAGDDRIILTVNKNNIAKKIYEKLGFKVYGEGIFEIGNGFVMDDYLMELNLKERK